jgi:hypothetical protein
MRMAMKVVNPCLRLSVTERASLVENPIPRTLMSSCKHAFAMGWNDCSAVGMIVALLMVVLDCRRQYCCTLRLGITSYPPPGSVCNVSSREVCLKARQKRR